jgi:hypothetical protein
MQQQINDAQQDMRYADRFFLMATQNQSTC